MTCARKMSKPKQDRMITYLKGFSIKDWYGIEPHKHNQLRQIEYELSANCIAHAQEHL